MAAEHRVRAELESACLGTSVLSGPMNSRAFTHRDSLYHESMLGPLAMVKHPANAAGYAQAGSRVAPASKGSVSGERCSPIRGARLSHGVVVVGRPRRVAPHSVAALRQHPDEGAPTASKAVVDDVVVVVRRPWQLSKADGGDKQDENLHVKEGKRLCGMRIAAGVT